MMVEDFPASHSTAARAMDDAHRSSQCGRLSEAAPVAEVENQSTFYGGKFDQLPVSAHRQSTTEINANSNAASTCPRPSGTISDEVEVDQCQTNVDSNGDFHTERLSSQTGVYRRHLPTLSSDDNEMMLRHTGIVTDGLQDDGGTEQYNGMMLRHTGIVTDGLQDDGGTEQYNGTYGTTTTLRSRALKSRYMNCRASENNAYIPTDVEHLANVITHGLWIVPSVMGLWWMTSISTSPLQHISAVIYGLSLFCLFTVSTTFHALAYCGRFRDLQTFFHIGDRAVIYIFIASSYTPWLVLKDFHRWSFLTLIIVWFAAMCGIYYQYKYHEQFKWLETLLYIIVAMAPSIIIVEMKESSGLIELGIGGALYVVGLIFFKCDGVVPFAHAIWHSFVFVGASFHFIAVCRHLLVEYPSVIDDGGTP